jgi:hypothetical protein
VAVDLTDSEKFLVSKDKAAFAKVKVYVSDGKITRIFE